MNTNGVVAIKVLFHPIEQNLFGAVLGSVVRNKAHPIEILISDCIELDL